MVILRNFPGPMCYIPGLSKMPRSHFETVQNFCFTFQGSPGPLGYISELSRSPVLCSRVPWDPLNLGTFQDPWAPSQDFQDLCITSLGHSITSRQHPGALLGCQSNQFLGQSKTTLPVPSHGSPGPLNHTPGHPGNTTGRDIGLSIIIIFKTFPQSDLVVSPLR